MIVKCINSVSSLLLFFSFCLVAMESPETSGMTEITAEQELVPFVSKVVAFRFNDKDVAVYNCWTAYVLNNAQLKYGLIDHMYHGIAFIGYQLIQIVDAQNAGESNFFWAVIRSVHIQKGLMVREANEQELVALHESMHSKKDICVIHKEAGLPMIEKQSGFEFQKRKLR